MRNVGVLLAGIAALVPFAATAQPQDRLAQPQGQFVAPTAPVVLTRTVRRALPDGKAVVATRSYSIQFERDGQGYLVQGALISSEVDAPASLRALAEMERTRPDQGLFPMRLDAAGQIVQPAVGDIPQPAPAPIAGGAKIVNRLSTAPLSPAEREQAKGFVKQVLAQGGALASWPEDLFHPLPGEHSVTRQLGLPDGTDGSVTVSTSAQVTPRGGLLDRVDRVVETRIGENRRIVQESWSIRPVQGGF